MTYACATSTKPKRVMVFEIQVIFKGETLRLTLKFEAKMNGRW